MYLWGCILTVLSSFFLSNTPITKWTVPKFNDGIVQFHIFRGEQIRVFYFCQIPLL